MDEKELKEAVAGLLKDKSQREALAELLVEYLQPNHLTIDFVGMLLNTRSLNPGDALVKKVRRGIKVRTLVPGSIHLKSEVTVTERINYVLDGAIVGINANEWELESGELGTVESLKAECAAKLKDYYMGKVFTALTSVWTIGNTPNNYIDAGAVITSGVLKTAIDYINQTAGGVKAVVGLRSKLTPITTFGASWSDGTANMIVPENIREIMATGWLGRYYGAPILALDQIYDNAEDHNAMIPGTRILVIGQNVGEFITFGAARSKEWTDPRPTPPYWNFELFQQFGLLVDNAQGIYCIEVD